MTYNVAVVGASGNVGRAMLDTLAQRKFPIKNLYPLASRRSVGMELSYGANIVKCQALEDFDFSGVDICLMSAGGTISKEYSPRIAAQGCVVIDNSSYWRMDPEVPLIVPEVNPQAIADFRAKNIIANPNCSTAQLVTALKPLHDAATITRLVISTYQSVSGAGKEAMDELYQQSKALAGGMGLGFHNHAPQNSKFTRRMAFNVIPHIDSFVENGSTKEEIKMVLETQKILDKDIAVTVTCVRVPVFVGHSEAVNVQFAEPLSPQQARLLLQHAEGCAVVDDPSTHQYTTPIECAGEDPVFISRIRADTTVPHGLNLWIVADNLRKGAALNAIQIAELLIERSLLKK